jgi:hypothetical protein
MQYLIPRAACRPTPIAPGGAAGRTRPAKRSRPPAGTGGCQVLSGGVHKHTTPRTHTPGQLLHSLRASDKQPEEWPKSVACARSGRSQLESQEPAAALPTLGDPNTLSPTARPRGSPCASAACPPGPLHAESAHSWRCLRLSTTICWVRGLAVVVNAGPTIEGCMTQFRARNFYLSPNLLLAASMQLQLDLVLMPGCTDRSGPCRSVNNSSRRQSPGHKQPAAGAAL